MEDRNLFDRFQAAFEAAPPNGAFERLHSELTKHSAYRRARPAFQMRMTKMTLRLAAAVAAVVITIALVTAYFAAQRPSTGSAPAGPGASVAAYQSLVKANADAVINSPWSCSGSLSDTNCPADIARVLAGLQKWSSDLNAFRTPPQFAIVDGQLRRHLASNFDVLNQALTAFHAGDEAKLGRALDATGVNVDFIDGVAVAIADSRPVTASIYAAVMQAQTKDLKDCASCNYLAARGGTTCAALDDTPCAYDIGVAAAQLSHFEVAVVVNAAPPGLADKDAVFQSDLAQADTALITMNAALLSGDAAALKSGRASYQDAFVAITADLQI